MLVSIVFRGCYIFHSNFLYSCCVCVVFVSLQVRTGRRLFNADRGIIASISSMFGPCPLEGPLMRAKRMYSADIPPPAEPWPLPQRARAVAQLTDLADRDAVCFLAELLDPNPTTRMSTVRALRHAYLRPCVGRIPGVEMLSHVPALPTRRAALLSPTGVASPFSSPTTSSSQSKASFERLTDTGDAVALDAPPESTSGVGKRKPMKRLRC